MNSRIDLAGAEYDGSQLFRSRPAYVGTILKAAAMVLCFTGRIVAAEFADLVLTDGKIVTVDSEFRIVQSMAVADGRVVALGSTNELQGHIGPSTLVVQLDGHMLLPGLIDSHVHPTGASEYEADHEIPSMDTIADVLAYVRARALVVPEGEWITLSQVFITRLREQRYPTREELDAAAPHHPVVFRTGPDASVNTLALKENGIDKEFAAAHPEQVLVDEHGEPNGLLRQQASILKTRSNSNQKTTTNTERDSRLIKLFQDYNRVGITGIIDRNCSDAARSQYERLLRNNQLSLRLRMSRSINPDDSLKEIEARLDGIAADPLFQSPKPRLGVIGVKAFLDGGMLTGSAYFSQPWGLSTIYGIEDPRYRGMRYIDEERLEELVDACIVRGLAFTAHCQGDAAVEALVRVYERVNERVPVSPTRSSLTHSSFMSESAIAGAAKLGIGVDLQPAWLYLDARTLLAQFGEERLKHFIPLHSLFEAGVRAGGGSDHMQKVGSLRSVNPYNPFLGMWIAATRQARWHDQPVHIEQALTREQMLQYYTINNAWLMRADKEIGSLEVGKYADFIVVDRDLLECPVDEIRDTQVLSTWLDGKRIE
ncbi:MAG: amidohydrolase [Planctomycetales bacterium]|nr:amidohydrolase [Planctomycetales bacterium]